MDRRNFSLLAVAGLLGLTAVKSSQASAYDIEKSADTKFAGIFRTTSNGSSLGGNGDFIDGRFESPKGSNNFSGDSEMIFNNDGTGISKVNAYVTANSHLGKQYMETIRSEYSFKYTITNDHKIKIFITENTWTDTYSEGPRIGKIYEKEVVLPILNDSPFLEGHLSHDGKNLQLTTKERIITRAIDSDGETLFNSAKFTVNGSKVLLK